jgi:hypothetical protein
MANGAPESRMVIFPASKAQLADDWHVSGLRGTGSGSFQVNDLLVPKSRSVSLAEDLPRETGALYKFPSFGLLALGIAAVAMGNAAGAIDSVKAIAVPAGVKGPGKRLLNGEQSSAPSLRPPHSSGPPALISIRRLTEYGTLRKLSLRTRRYHSMFGQTSAWPART